MWSWRLDWVQFFSGQPSVTSYFLIACKLLEGFWPPALCVTSDVLCRLYKVYCTPGRYRLNPISNSLCRMESWLVRYVAPFLAMFSNCLLRLLFLVVKLLSIKWGSKSSSGWQSGVQYESEDQQSLQHDYQQLRHFAQICFFSAQFFLSCCHILFVFH